MIDHSLTVEQQLRSQLDQIEKNLSPFPELSDDLKELIRTVKQFIEDNTDDWK